MLTRTDTTTLPIVRTVAQLRSKVRDLRKDGAPIAIVPTMGALHEGHLSLVRAALQHTPHVIATIFVNPKQFNDPKDLTSYPKTEQEDAAKLRATGASLLFAPSPSEVYPEGFSSSVSVRGVSEGLCGGARPGHFDGVATVVTKLFLQSGADLAFFGEKDFQQLQVIKRLVNDLDIPIDVIGCPTVREEDGLAMSSRNLLLSAQDRKKAPILNKLLREVSAKLRAGAAVEPTLVEARDTILSSGFSEVDYLELRSEEGLEPLDRLDRPARLLVAARLGTVRLIDNLVVRLSE